MTLSAANVYKLNGCVTVKSGVTLTIPAGTAFTGIKTTGAQAFLIVERNGRDNCQRNANKSNHLYQ